MPLGIATPLQRFEQPRPFARLDDSLGRLLGRIEDALQDLDDGSHADEAIGQPVGPGGGAGLGLGRSTCGLQSTADGDGLNRERRGGVGGPSASF